jgi:hypothetical protein
VSEVSSKLSTSALAKRLKLPIQQLFATLRDYGWIERRAESWALTAKGELHGGGYQDSQRYGRYIVWPESLAEHPMIDAIESDQRITAGAMRRYYSHLSTCQINQSLAEMGLQQIVPGGFEITPLGRRFGGRQARDEDSGLSSVTWPHEMVDDPVVHRELRRRQDGQAVSSPASTEVKGSDDASTPDLFFDAAEPEEHNDGYCAVDGHRVDSQLQLKVCDWLYGAQLAHALQRTLPSTEPLYADFYVPAAKLYIECWERDVPTAELSRRLRTRELCRELELAYLEVAADDVDRLDDLLAEKLRECGVPC